MFILGTLSSEDEDEEDDADGEITSANIDSPLAVDQSLFMSQISLFVMTIIKDLRLDPL